MPHKAILPLLVLLAAVALTQCRPRLAPAERPADSQARPIPAFAPVFTARDEHKTPEGTAATFEAQAHRSWSRAATDQAEYSGRSKSKPGRAFVFFVPFVVR